MYTEVPSDLACMFRRDQQLIYFSLISFCFKVYTHLVHNTHGTPYREGFAPYKLLLTELSEVDSPSAYTILAVLDS